MRGSRRKLVTEQLANMLVRHLSVHAFENLTSEEMADRLGVALNIFSMPWWQDVPIICEAASLDLGLVIRDSKGNEVVFWPADNFIPGTKSRGVAAKGTPPIPKSRVVGFVPGRGSEDGEGAQ